MNAGLAGAARDAAGRYGTPLYLYDLLRLRADLAALSAAFPDPWLRLYSLKANGLPALVGEIHAAGFAASAVSGGELALAARAGVAPGRTALEGIGKTEADLARAARLAAAGSRCCGSASRARRKRRCLPPTPHAPARGSTCWCASTPVSRRRRSPTSRLVRPRQSSVCWPTSCRL